MGDWRAVIDDATAFAKAQAAFDRDGYILFESVLPEAEVEALRSELQPWLDADIAGRNDFEGLKTNRVYGMLGKSPLFADLACHPLALAFAEADLGLLPAAQYPHQALDMLCGQTAFCQGCSHLILGIGRELLPDFLNAGTFISLGHLLLKIADGKIVPLLDHSA